MDTRQDKQRREALTLSEIVRAELYRALPSGGYGEPEAMEVEDLIVNNGRIFLARRIAGGDAQTAPGSAMAYMAVGTVSTGPALADTTLTGEVKRKALSANSANVNNIYTAVTTFGGAADTVTSLQIQEAGIFNHASSGQGTMFQRVTFATVTLADSDLLKVTLETNCGSNTI
jgi:hypothetical protein